MKIIDTFANTDKCNPLDIVVVFICRMDPQRERTGWTWGKAHLEYIKENKPNIINKNTGNLGFRGYHYLYGNNCNNGNTNSFSVG